CSAAHLKRKSLLCRLWLEVPWTGLLVDIDIFLSLGSSSNDRLSTWTSGNNPDGAISREVLGHMPEAKSVGLPSAIVGLSVDLETRSLVETPLSVEVVA